METGKIKTLYSDMERTEALFPRTKTSAVSNDDGRGLDALLENLPYFSSVDSSEAATVPMDADTLGGLPAENYATQSFVTNKIAEAQVGGSGGDIDLSGYATKDDLNSKVSTSCTVNGKALSSNITLSASDLDAAPAGFGLGESSPRDIEGNDANNALLTGVYWISPTTTNVPSNAWLGIMDVKARSENTCVQTIYYFADDATHVYTRNVRDGVYYKWKDRGPSAFAPAGYGLGDNSKWIANRNQIDGSGFYQLDPEGKDMPDEYAWWGTVSKLYGDTHIFIATRYDGCVAQSMNIGSGWQPWEWVNPPMLPGVEYRTTKRHDGKPVYVRMVETGALPNASYLAVEGLADYVDKLVDATLVVLSSDGSANWINTETDLSWYIGNYGTPYTAITTHTDMSSRKARITIAYTKTTD